jgi:transposase
MFLIATHLDQSNHLPNQKQGAVDKHDLIVYISSEYHDWKNRRFRLWTKKFNENHNQVSWKNRQIPDVFMGDYLTFSN